MSYRKNKSSVNVKRPSGEISEMDESEKSEDITDDSGEENQDETEETSEDNTEKSPESPPEKRRRLTPPEIKNISDMITFIMTFDREADYGFDTRNLPRLLSPLVDFEMIRGMDSIKDAVLGQILYLLQRYHSDRDFLHTVITGKPGVGKCLGIDTPVLMFDGSVKRVQDIAVGDLLMGDDSLPRRVLSTCRGRERMYRVRQDNGDDYTVNESHILSLRRRHCAKPCDTLDICIGDYLRNRHLMADYGGFKVGVEFPERSLHCDPYSVGLHLRHSIPHDYKCNSRRNRLRLLAGIVDAHGGLRGQRFEIVLEDRILAEDIAFVARSLGLRVDMLACTEGGLLSPQCIRIVVRGCGLQYIPTRLGRLPESTAGCAHDTIRGCIQNCTDDDLVYGIELEEIGTGDYYGFVIDGNHRFLLGDFTVTHNTELAKILARIYAALGFLKTDKVTVVKPADLISQWIGGTTMNTKAALERAMGGVLLIDEAYALGREEGEKDAFAGECINVLNQYLSERRNDFVCIIAGYRDALENKFFNINKGMARRFPWRYHIDDYSPDTLADIFESQVVNQSWDVDPTAIEYLRGRFRDGTIEAENFGGDSEVLFTCCKICHARKSFGKEKNYVLDIMDIKAGIEMYTRSKNSKGGKKDEDPPFGLYI